MKPGKEREILNKLTSAQMQYLAKLRFHGGAWNYGRGYAPSKTELALERLGLIQILRTKVRLTKTGWSVSALVMT